MIQYKTCRFYLKFRKLIQGIRIFGFPGASDSKEFTYNAREPSLTPGLGRCPRGGNGYPLQYSCFVEFHKSLIPQVELDGLQSTGSQRVRHDLATNTHFSLEFCLALNPSDLSLCGKLITCAVAPHVWFLLFVTNRQMPISTRVDSQYYYFCLKFIDCCLYVTKLQGTRLLQNLS